MRGGPGGAPGRLASRCACSPPSASLGTCAPAALATRACIPAGRPALTMTAHSFALPVIIFTTFWGIIGIAGPWFVPKGPNRG